MKCKINIILFLICTLLLLPHLLFSIGNREQSQPLEEMNPAINWEFLCKDLTGNIKVLQYNEIFEITSGIQYRVHFKTLKTIYVYIFLYGTDENIILLFPSNVIYFGNRLNTGIIYSIPEENDRWLPLEQNTHIKNLYFHFQYPYLKIVHLLIVA